MKLFYFHKVFKNAKIIFFSSNLRLAMQCGDITGSYFKIFVNGINLSNYTPSSGSFHLDHVRIEL